MFLLAGLSAARAWPAGARELWAPAELQAAIAEVGPVLAVGAGRGRLSEQAQNRSRRRATKRHVRKGPTPPSSSLR
jgi:hypothetical protein